MLQRENLTYASLRYGAISGIGVLLFMPGVILQIASGWFPGQALREGKM